MLYSIEHKGRIRCIEDLSLPPIEEMDQITDAIMESLLALPDAVDADLSATLVTGELIARFGIEASSPLEAMTKADVVFRTALHAAGIFTPDWTGPRETKDSGKILEDCGWNVSPTNLIDA